MTQPMKVTYTVFVDGACSGNPGAAAAGIYLLEGRRVVREYGVVLDGEMTNNEAEYRAVLKGLREAHEIGGTHITIKSDSQLVMRQITGEYGCNVPTLAALRDRARRCAATFVDCRFEWIPREQNEKADALASEALGRVVDKAAFNFHNFQQALKERDFWHAEAQRLQTLCSQLEEQQEQMRFQLEQASFAAKSAARQGVAA